MAKRHAGQWKPGQSGNPGGRPKSAGPTLTDVLREQLDLYKVQTPEGLMNAKRALARKLIQLALVGNIAAIKYVYDRCEGRPAIVNKVLDEAELPPMIIARTKDQLERVFSEKRDEMEEYRAPEDDDEYDTQVLDQSDIAAIESVRDELDDDEADVG